MLLLGRRNGGGQDTAVLFKSQREGLQGAALKPILQWGESVQPGMWGWGEAPAQPGAAYYE